MVAYNGGVLTAFSNCGDAAACVRWSQDGQGLGAGPRRYAGNSPVTAMVAYKDGVLTAFSNCGDAAACVHWSQDGQGLGAGPRRYAGSSPVTAMIAYKDGVLTAFSNCGPPNPQPACVHWSQDGQILGAGPRVYAGSYFVASIRPFRGVLPAFNGLPAPTDPNYCPLPSSCGSGSFVPKGPHRARCVADGAPGRGSRGHSRLKFSANKPLPLPSPLLFSPLPLLPGFRSLYTRLYKGSSAINSV
jgi:hypothetical protein